MTMDSSTLIAFGAQDVIDRHAPADQGSGQLEGESGEPSPSSPCVAMPGIGMSAIAMSAIAMCSEWPASSHPMKLLLSGIVTTAH